LRDHLLGLLGQRVGGLIEGDFVQEGNVAVDDGHADPAGDDGDHQQKRRARAQAVVTAGGRYHLRRGRFARGQRGGQRIAAGQRGRNRQRARWPALRVGRQAPLNDPFNRRVQILHQARQRRRRRAVLQLLQFGARLRRVRLLAAEHLVQHQAERVDVAFGGNFEAGELLRRHVGGGAGADIGLDLFGQPGQAEVGDHQLALAVQQQVGRFQIAM
jgi:hypothetical protein